MKINNTYQNQDNMTYSSPNEQVDGEGKTTFKYELVGTMIRIMLVKNGVEVSCVKSIPVKSAPPEIIAKIENLTFIDMVMINDLKNEKNQVEEVNEDLPKEHMEYEKHSLFE